MPKIVNLVAIVVLSIAVLAGMTLAALNSSAPPARERSIESVIEDLANPDVDRVQAAERELERRWPDSREALEIAAESDDAVIAGRATRLIQHLTPTGTGIE